MIRRFAGAEIDSSIEAPQRGEPLGPEPGPRCERPPPEIWIMDFPGHFQNIFQQLNQQRLQAQMCDCAVEVGGQRFQAHRAILAACSSHFKALLGDPAGGAVVTLDPGVVTPAAFATLLDMIYTSTLSLRASDVMDVLLAASHLHLNSVVKACKMHLSRRNFPSAPPEGWRSVSSSGEVEVSQSGGAEEEEQVEEVQVQWVRDRREKRKHQERTSNRKRSCRSPEVTRSCSEETKDQTSLKIHITEVEAKYESDEVQLPSSSSCGGTWEASGDAEVKVKEGEETRMLEVKKESPDPTLSPSSPLQDSSQLLTAVDSLQAQLGLPEGEEGLEGLSDLAFSSFLNPDCVMGGLGEEEGLAGLRAAAAATEAPGDSSLVLTPVPQLVPGQSPGFSGTLILQPGQNFLQVQLSGGTNAGASGGGTVFRRIAPKARPESEPDPTPEPDPPFVRASEETVAKCKKAAAEDLVLLVEGEKKYACRICSKTFMNLTDCRKHIRVHTGEKPYPCLRCGKRFSQSSHLYKHCKNSTCLSWRSDPTLQDLV